MKDVLKRCYESDFAIFKPAYLLYILVHRCSWVFIAAFLTLASSSEIAVVVIEVSEKLYI